MANYDKRLCLVCGQEFEPVYVSQITCSDECRKMRKRTTNKAYKKNLKARVKLMAIVIKEQADAITNLKNKLTEAYQQIQELQFMLESAQKSFMSPKLEDLPQAPVVDNPVQKLPAPPDMIEIEAIKKEVKEKEETKICAKKKQAQGQKTIPKIKDVIPADIVLLECERMKVKAIHLPCGQRKECWENTPCKKTKGMEKPDFSKENMKELWKSFGKKNTEGFDGD